MTLINGTIFNDNNTADSTGVLRPALIGDLRGIIAEADTINGDRGDDIIQGLSGNDTLNGGDGIDSIDGGIGNDNISGNKGDDIMIGGAGNDRLFWIDGDGSDTISGGTGSDIVSFTGASIRRPNSGGVQGDDILSLTFDSTSQNVFLRRTNLTPVTLKIDSVERFEISGVEGNDNLTVGSLIGSGVSSIRFSGGAGNDFLIARDNGTATMSVFGDGGNDILLAGNLSDRLEGGDGNDSLVGNSGNDILIGVNTGNLVSPGRGEQDLLMGGVGSDRFVLGSRGVNGRALVYYDDGDLNFDGGNNVFTGMDGVSDFAHIVDFVSGQDRIQLVGSANEYVIRDIGGSLSRGSSVQDVGIFKARPNLFAPDELVAIVQDVGSGRLDLTNRSQFNFV